MIGLLPNPDEPEPNKASLQNFLLNVQEFHWLGPTWSLARRQSRERNR